MRNLVFVVVLPLSLWCQAQQPFDAVAEQAAHARDSEHLEDAIKLYRKGVQLRPEWAEGWWYLGTLAYDQQQYQEAIGALSKVTNLAPKDANAFAMLGLSEAKLNQNHSALTHLTAALTLGVGDDANLRQVVLFTQANLLLDDGAFGRAQEILEGMVQVRKEHGDEVVIALGRSVLGVNSADAAANSEERDLILTAGRAEVLSINREIGPAMTAYGDLVKRFPKVHNVEFAYGRFLLRNHLDDQAVAAFKREIENSPQHLLARVGIAGIMLSTDPAISRTYAEQALTLSPKLEEAHYLLGASLLATGSLDRAVAELEIAERSNSNDARVYFALAKAYRRLDRDADAERARERFAQLNQAH